MSNSAEDPEPSRDDIVGHYYCDGAVYIADKDFARIHRRTPTGEPSGTIALAEGEEAALGCFTVQGDHLLIPDRVSDRLLCRAFP